MKIFLYFNRQIEAFCDTLSGGFLHLQFNLKENSMNICSIRCIAVFVLSVLPAQAYWPFGSSSASAEPIIKVEAHIVVLTAEHVRSARQDQALLQMKIEQCKEDIHFKASQLQKISSCNFFDQSPEANGDQPYQEMMNACALEQSNECDMRINELNKLRDDRQKKWDTLKNEQEQLLKEIKEKNKLIKIYAQQVALIEQKIREFQNFKDDVAQQELLDRERSLEDERDE